MKTKRQLLERLQLFTYISIALAFISTLTGVYCYQILIHRTEIDLTEQVRRIDNDRMNANSFRQMNETLQTLNDKLAVYELKLQMQKDKK